MSACLSHRYFRGSKRAFAKIMQDLGIKTKKYSMQKNH
jgi:hypothetical protein